MSDNVYKKVELVGTSAEGLEQAISNALARASKSIRHMGWFEVKEIRGDIREGKVGHYQVTLEVGFRLDEE
jgi:flavin-binding protein dodecin